MNLKKVSLFGLSRVTSSYIQYLNDVGIEVDYVVNYTASEVVLKDTKIVILEEYLNVMCSPLVICAFNLDNKSVCLNAINFINQRFWLHKILDKVPILHPSFIVKFYKNLFFNGRIKFENDHIYINNICINEEVFLNSVDEDAVEMLWVKESILEVFLFSMNLKYHIPIVVNTAPKTGSLSLYFSLLRQSESNIFHAHFFNDKYSNPKHTNYSSMTHWKITDLFDRVINSSQKVKIVNMIRDPFERVISNFFQLYELVENIKFSNYTIEELIQMFENDYLKRDINDFTNTKIHLFYLDNWYQEWIVDTLKIDIFKEKFSQERYKVYQNDNIELLILDSALKDEVKEKVIGDFIGNEKFKLERYNDSENKEYIEQYREFKKTYKFDNDIVKQLKNSKGYRYFYG